ncbi:MFS transporter [Actinoplanes sp. TBRC 11911]|uniref:MFS transporter n=1 Tax=Actinoplanes sp. TBRC 11911 TaxID=2729386 RepID=UPI00145EEE58|nr:MFS transporter [Actinoplanes sp. TBRC 11911]NMO51167.1 MFS transporter [Actinoplanes sp. TBRC 11911]
MTNDQTFPRRWAMLPAVLTASFMTLFDFNVVNVAAPSLQHDLNAGSAALELVVGGYAFTYASGMVIGGRLGDQIGHRRMFLIGLLSFGLASLLCGIAQSPGQLIAARLLQGLTGAVMVPQVLALITRSFPAHERPKAMSWFGMTLALGGVAGQILGGILIQANLFGWNWRPIFLVNVPVSIIAFIAATRLLPQHERSARHRFDAVGAIGIAGSLGLVLAPLILGRDEGWPFWFFLIMAAAIPLFVFTLWWERRFPEPVLDLNLFRSRAFAVGLPANALWLGYFGSFSLVLTLLWQSGLHLSALQAGLAFLPLGVLFAVVSVLGRNLVARMGPKAITAGGLVVAAGLILMIVELQVKGGDITVAWLLPATGLVGIGNGFAFLALIGSVLANVSPTQAGAASGVLTTTQQFANAAGVAIFGSLFFTFLGSRTSLAAYASSTRDFAYLALICVLAAAALALRINRRQPAVTPAAPQQPVATSR